MRTHTYALAYAHAVCEWRTVRSRRAHSERIVRVLPSGYARAYARTHMLTFFCFNEP